MTKTILVVLVSSGLVSCIPPPATGTKLHYRIQTKPDVQIRDAVDRTVAVLKERLYSVRWARIEAGDDGAILVWLPGDDGSGISRIRRIVEEPGTLEFRIVAEPEELAAAGIDAAAEAEKRKSASAEAAERSHAGFGWFEYEPSSRTPAGDGEFLKLDDASVVPGSLLRKVFGGSDSIGNPAIHFEMNQAGSDKMRRLTEANTGRRMAIVVNGKVQSAPIIKSKIEGSGVIEKPGGYSKEELKEWVTILRSGELPGRLVLVREEKY